MISPRSCQDLTKVFNLGNIFYYFVFKPKCNGKALYNVGYEHLNIEEQEYFGINFHEKNDNLVSTPSRLVFNRSNDYL